MRKKGYYLLVSPLLFLAERTWECLELVKKHHLYKQAITLSEGTDRYKVQYTSFLSLELSILLDTYIVNSQYQVLHRVLVKFRHHISTVFVHRCVWSASAGGRSSGFLWGPKMVHFGLTRANFSALKVGGGSSTVGGPKNPYHTYVFVVINIISVILFCLWSLFIFETFIPRSGLVPFESR